MRVLDVRREATALGSRVVARVEWEEARRGPDEVFFEVRAPHHERLAPNPGAFLVAVAWPAFHAGERRIAVEGPLCPRLSEGVATYLRIVRRWRQSKAPVPAIEPSGGFALVHPRPTRRTAMFLSGGVDSLDLLRQNAATCPGDHPLRVREAIFVHGLDIGAPRQRPRERFFERVRQTLDPVVASASVEIVVARTNVRALAPGWADYWFGSGTIAIAHALDALTDVLIAASFDVEGLVPVGSHPLTDPRLSSGALDVRHEGLHRSRLQKIASVLDWPEARAALRVCWQDLPEDGPLNCGACRKCVRARLGVEALGRLGDTPTLPAGPLTTADLDACTVDPTMAPFYEELIPPLRARGREDLADVLRARLDERRAPRGSWWRRARRVVGLP